MTDDASAQISPAGMTVRDDLADALRVDSELARGVARLAPYERIARVVLRRRHQLGISQAELARRMGTTASVVSRIESGQHAISMRTLARLAEALGGVAVIDIAFSGRDRGVS